MHKRRWLVDKIWPLMWHELINTKYSKIRRGLIPRCRDNFGIIFHFPSGSSADSLQMQFPTSPNNRVLTPSYYHHPQNDWLTEAPLPSPAIKNLTLILSLYLIWKLFFDVRSLLIPPHHLSVEIRARNPSHFSPKLHVSGGPATIAWAWKIYPPNSLFFFHPSYPTKEY